MASINFSNYQRNEIKIKIIIDTNVFEGRQVKKVKIIRGTNAKENFKIGTSVSALAEFSIFDENPIFDKIIFSNKIAKIEIGVNYGIDVEWVTMGHYILETPTKNADKSWSFVGYDNLQKTRKPFDYSKLKYPMTIKDMVIEACNQSGITLDTISWKNSNEVITKPIQFYEATCKDVIDSASELGLCVSLINPITNNLEIRSYIEETNYINGDLIYHFKKEEENERKGFDKLIISQTGTSDYVLGSGNLTYYIEDNLFIQGDASRFGMPIFNALSELHSNKNIELAWKGDPTLKDYGVYSFNYEGKNYKIIPQMRTFEYDGGLKETIECKSPLYKKDTSSEIKLVRNIYKTNARLEVAKNEILASVKNEVDGRLSELKLTDEGIEQKVSSTVTSKLSDPTIQSKITTNVTNSLKVDNSFISSISQKTINDANLGNISNEISELKQNYNSFNLKLEQNRPFNVNLIRNTETFTQTSKVEMIYDSNVYFTELYANNLRIYNKEGGFADLPSFRIEIPLNQSVKLKGQTFWLSFSAMSRWSGATVFRYRLKNGDGVWSDDVRFENKNTNFELGAEGANQYRYFRQKIVAPNTGNICDGIYLQVYIFNPNGKNPQTEMIIQPATLKLEIGEKPTAWSRAETDEIKNTNYYFGKDGVKFSYNNKDVLTLDPLKGLTIDGNGSFAGSINSTSGTIGNFIISQVLRSRPGQNGAFIQLDGRGGGTNFIQAGDNTHGNRFSVSSNGSVYSYGSNQVSANMTNGSYSGDHSGYGSFSSGNYTGNGYFYDGTSIAGASLTNLNDGLHSRVLSAQTIHFDTLQGWHSGTTQGYWTRATLHPSGWSFSNSDIRLKENIEELTAEYNEYIYNLPLIKYNYISDKDKTPQAGVNANHLMKILPEDMARSFLHQDKNTGLYGAKYELLVPYLIKTIQDLNKRLKKLENKE